jgi:uncharacterized ferritin-like protein (DUF455 family)
MELREFAEQVLFATTLEAKLDTPETVTDENPGSAMAAPVSPGRPAGLGFKPQGGGGGDFPGLHRLEHEQERGRLLHFFANHELLATELMALVLLRFPDAPAAFRRGVFQTLKDEQEHTRMYLRRMKACGIEFGQLPVSGYFWRSVSTMENPMDYVAGLSLTFEQANLDFCRQFAQGFQAVGDVETAGLLEQIYRDEIAHVAYGLKWFRRWKNPNESDWEAFCRQLKFPLSPNRAKGGRLNVEGRKAAGFDLRFIDELNVFSRSKGRTPSVFWFNPFSEGRIAQGKSFTPVKAQQCLAADLANLPQFLARLDDVVLVPQRPSVAFLSQIKQAGFPLPEFVEWDGRSLRPGSPLLERKLGRLRPWAWGPDSVEALAQLFPQVTGETRTAADSFTERMAPLYSKTWSADFLRRHLSRWSGEAWVCGEFEVGRTVDTLNDAWATIAEIRSAGHHRVVVKEALGLAGQGMMRLWEPEVLESQRRWMGNVLESGGRLVVEPWLEREIDFSVQLESEASGLRLVGYTGLLNDPGGQFRANWATPHHDRRPPAEVVMALRALRDGARRLQAIFEEVRIALQPELMAAGYRGPLGIDAFLYRNSAGDLRLKPVVEINPRYTMGRLTLELMTRVHHASTGRFRLVSQSQLRSEGDESFWAYARRLTEADPVVLEGEPVPRIRRGTLPLNDPATAQAYLAVLEVK